VNHESCYKQFTFGGVSDVLALCETHDHISCTQHKNNYSYIVNG